MNIHLKSGIIIGVTLIIGIILGIQIDRMLVRSHFHKQISRNRPPDDFIRVFEQIIQPTEQQRAELKKVMERHAPRLAAIDSLVRTNIAVATDSLKKDLEPILTEEQKKRLFERFERFKSRRKNGPPFMQPPMQDGPPPFMEPPGQDGPPYMKPRGKEGPPPHGQPPEPPFEKHQQDN